MGDSNPRDSARFPSFINLTPQGFAGALEGHPFELDNSLAVRWLDQTPSPEAYQSVHQMLIPRLQDYLGASARVKQLLDFCQHQGRDMGGITLGRPKIGAPIYFNSQSTHLITMGTTGYGKFVRNIAPACLQYRGAVVVIDPKGEAAAVTARARFEQHGQIPCLFDPFGQVRELLGGQLPAHAVEVSYNPLRELDAKSKNFAADAVRLANAMLTSKSEKEPMWRNNAIDLLTGLIMYVCTQPDDSKPRDLPYLRDLLSSTTEQWQFLFLCMARSDIKGVRDCARRMQGFPEITFGGIVAQCNSDLFFLDDPIVCAALSDQGENQFSFGHLLSNNFLPHVTEEDFAHFNTKMAGWEHKDELLELLCCGGYSLYIIIPLDYSESHSGLLRLLVNSFLSKSTRMRRFGPQTLLLIDEAAQLGNLEMLATAYSAGRSNNLRVWSFWQDFGQIKACYPEKHSSITGNAMQILLGTTNLDTAEHFSKVAGMDIKMVRSSVSHTSGTNTGESTGEGENNSFSSGTNTGNNSGSSSGWGGGGSNSGSSSGSSWGSSQNRSNGSSTNRGRSSGQSSSDSYTDSRVVEPKIRPEDILTQCGPASNQALVFTGGQPLFWVHTVRYFEEPMARLADPNPYYEHGA